MCACIATSAAPSQPGISIAIGSPTSLSQHWDIVENGVLEPSEGEKLTEAQSKALADRKLKNLKANNYFFQAIDRPILETILQMDTSKHIWDSMKKKYLGTIMIKASTTSSPKKII